MIASGTIIGKRYRILRQIGGGGMKTVYLAEDERLASRSCAIAEMIDNFSDPRLRAKAAEAFRREAELLATLRHKHIPGIYDSFTESQRHFLVMEYIDGETLEAIKDTGGALDTTRTLDIALEILDTLEYLHSRNPPVLYRDLKPSNVMIGRDGGLKLIDFGIARHFQPDETATMVGTHGYAPPEQYRGKNEPQSDLYALGALIHYLLTGRDPSKEAPFSFPPLERFRTDLPPALCALLNEALFYDLNTRVASASEFKRRLLAVRSGALRAANRPAISSEPTARLAGDANRLKKSRRTALTSLLFTMIILAAGYIYFTPSVKERLGIRPWLKSRVLVEVERQVDRARNQCRSGADIADLTRPDQNSLNLLVRSAQSGSREDQSRLGFVYYFGLGVTRNTADAFYWWSKAAQEGDPDGEVDLGWMYLTGEGAGKDYDEALKWLREAADQGNADGEVNLGVMYENGAGVAKDYDEALKWFREAADQGYADGEVDLGAMYETGEGVVKDYGEAQKWFRKAADQGAPDGEAALGWMYVTGEGVGKDYDKALKWLREAADQGNADGEVNLGVMYENGEGVDKDYSEAQKWFRKAADQGAPDGEAALGRMYANGEGVAKDHDEALKWVRKAADQGNAEAQTALGSMYANGEGVPRDDHEALKWFRKAVAQGAAEGEFSLGRMYLAGKGVPQDYDEALKWFRKAANQSNADAQVALGVMYEEGKGVPRDYREAFKFYRNAADQGNATREANLGLMYAYGKGVPGDCTQALNWLEKASRDGSKEAQLVIRELYSLPICR